MADVGRFAADLTLDMEELAGDFFVQLPGTALGQDLLDLLGEGSGRPVPPLYVERTGALLAPSSLLVDLDLVAGDRLTPAPAQRQNELSTVEFRVVGGPDAERTLRVVSGTELGRWTDSSLDDDSVSRRHCMIVASASGVLVTDLGSRNGTLVNGVPVSNQRPSEMFAGDRLEIGSMVLELVGRSQPPRVLETTGWERDGGYLNVRRQPRVAYPQPPLELRIPDPPPEPPKRRFPIGAAVLPVVLGAVMALLLGPLFALLTAAAPVMLIFTHFDDKRSGRKDFEEQVAAYRSELRSTGLQIADAVEQDIAGRRRRAPGLGAVTGWVRGGAKELWSRRPGDAERDFLVVAPADAPQTSGVTVEVPRTGARQLLDEAARVTTDLLTSRPLPVEVDLAETPVIGIVGRSDLIMDVARGVVAQLAALRSYRDLQIAVLAPKRVEHWSWTRWLPHVRIDLDSNDQMVAADDGDAKVVFDILLDIQAQRLKASEDRIGAGRPTFSPTYLVVLHPPLQLPARAVSRFLERAGETGFVVLTVVDEPIGLPDQARVLVQEEQSQETVEVTYAVDGRQVRQATPRRLGRVEAEQLARDLAPLVDVSAGLDGGEIPRRISLHELLGDDDLTAAAIEQRWRRRDGGLPAIVGATADGALTLDLKRDGPHGLVAGTTGAGKSEFLQTLVAGLAVQHAPHKLNFILVDYKGGSAFSECADLPHTIGFVTNLDDHLADRALVSLTAELRRRQELFKSRSVPDLSTMIARHPDEAPPAVLIVIDEFAVLKTEVPEFVDGLVYVAQQGRSMGVHMILATQQPNGVITPQIDANTNFRVALRVASQGDSNDVIGSGAAADIGVDRAGRAYLKVGGGSKITAFQSAYVGGRSGASNAAVVASIEPFAYGHLGRRRSETSGAAGDLSTPTDLVRIVAETRVVWEHMGAPALHKPWQPPLPEVVTFRGLDRRTLQAPSTSFPIGLADYPEQQIQRDLSLDLAGLGNVAIFGVAGSGKTTFIRSLFCAASICSAPGRLALYGLDFGGALGSLEALPTVGSIVPGTDSERLQLLLSLLEQTVTVRRELGRQHGTNSLAELERVMDSPPPRMIVAIDGFSQFWALLGEFNHGRDQERFERLFNEAPSVGIHFVVSATQRIDIPYVCTGSIGLRLLQRLPRDEYTNLGIAKPPSQELMPPGRTLLVDGPEVQIVVAGTGDDVSGAAQADWIRQVAERLRAAGYQPPRRVEALGAEVDPAVLPATGDLSAVPIGLNNALEPVAINLEALPTYLIVGEAGSGRTTALATILHGLGPVTSDRRIIATKSSSPFRSEGIHPGALLGGDPEIELTQLADEVRVRAREGWSLPLVLAMDDVEALLDNGTIDNALGTILFNARDAGVAVLATATLFRAIKAWDSWFREMVSNGHGLVLKPDSAGAAELFDVPFPRGQAISFPTGRGYSIARSGLTVVQIAHAAP